MAIAYETNGSAGGSEATQRSHFIGMSSREGCDLAGGFAEPLGVSGEMLLT